MIDIMSLTRMGGQVALNVTPEDLHHFAEMLLMKSRKEWEEKAETAHKDEPEETFLTTDEVCKIFNVCPATLWQWHRTGYLQHIKFGNKNMYPASAVKAITNARSLNETVSGYCKRTSKVDKEMLKTDANDRKEDK
ncbi:MAG: helix-turn-helix domain-containing protein [Prevotella sp.]|nr:helix-turn-helix domain-containing protein [Prevotella sp.]